MDINPSQLPLPSSSTGPQIRSRITVVCAECKRLKLKCDRRTPCGSCTKRDTVARCIYSPAAAEKVDLHSLNNRLIQVESALAIMTAGQTIPAFQSSYHFSHPSSSSSCAQPLPASSTGGSHHHHHHHNAAPYSSENDSLALSAEDLAIWLEDLDLGVSQSTASLQVPQSDMQNSGFIKLEPSPTEMELIQPHHGMITLDTSSAQRSVQPSRSSSPFKPDAQQQQQFFLPPLSIYHSAPAIVPSSPSVMSSSSYPQPSTPAYTFPQSSQYSHPQITSALLSQLPSFSHCTKLLRNAEEVFSMRPIPFNTTKGGWKAFKRKCLAVLSGPLASQHERDAARQQRESRKAKAIYYHGGQAQPGDDMDGIGGVWNKDGGGETSLSFFGCMCAVLAVGAHAAPSRSGENSTNTPAFLYALSQQALGVWETHAAGAGAGVEEPERMDFLLASLVSTVYVLYSRSTLSSSSSSGEEDGGDTGAVVSPLVGKMYNVARYMGLGRDVGRRKSAKSKGRGREREREEMRRMIWWDVLFYDLFTSDILGQPPLAPSFTYTTKLPECASAEEDEESEHDSHDDDDDAESGSASSSEMYFGVRCRLTQLAQMIKQRTATPDCCCGYTLDQAANLDSEIRRFIDRLPAALRLSTSGLAAKGSEDSPMILDSPPPLQPEKIDKEKTTLLVQSAELAIMANVLVWKIYVPFLRPTSSSSPSSSSSQPKSLGAWSSASQACVSAAQEILSAAKVLLNTNYSVIPTIFDFYPLNKVVFDATVVCAHASLTTKVNDKDLEAQFAEGLECASKLNGKSEWRKTVLGALNKRLAAGNQGRGIAASSLKRKRSQHEHGPRSMGSGQGGDSIPPPSGFDAPLYQGFELHPSATFPSPHQSPPSTQRGRESLPSPPTSRASGSAQSKTSTGGKDKKHAKKTHASYPVVGIRARLKESGPLVPKHKTASETTMDGGRERGKMQAPPPLMTSIPRMMSRECSAANMYPPPQQSPVHSKSSMLTMSTTDAYRSRSSSLSHVQAGVEPSSQQSHSLDYLPFGEYRMREQQQMSSPVSYNSSPQMFNHPHPQQPHQQQVQTSLFDLGPPPPHGYDQRSFDRVQASVDSAASYASTGAPSPCANPSHSSASSPYTSSSGSVGGQPPTPTLTYGTTTAGSHHRNPSAFAHPSATTTSSTSASSPAGYIHFDEGSSGSGLSMAGLQATIEQATAISSSVPSTPAAYERQANSMYDAKPPMDALLPPHAYESLHSHQMHQQEQFHRGPGDALQLPPPAYSDPHGHPHHRMTSVEGEQPTQTWPGPPASSQAATGQPFWNGYA